LTEPTIFGEGVISTRDHETGAAFTPDGAIVYFTKSTPDLAFRVIVFSRYEGGGWSTPEVAPFSGQYRDADPFITADGSKLFFISDRPVAGKRSEGRRDLDIWMVSREGERWGEPRHLSAPINSDANESSPSVTADGTLYFSSNREGGRGAADLYRTRMVNGAYAAPESLGEAINTSHPETQVFVTPDESVLVLAAAGWAGGQGGLDLYLSRRQDGAWSRPVNMGGKINSSGNESAPRLSPDGNYFIWTSTRGYGFAGQMEKRLAYQELIGRLRNAANSLGDIYLIDVAALEVWPARLAK
jgi:Tol biopolymer transport system component